MKSMRRSYTDKQKRALNVFHEYVSSDEPYKEMKRSRYKMLGKLYKQLPGDVFKTVPNKHLYHLSVKGNDLSNLTESGILSCTTRSRVDYITKEFSPSLSSFWVKVKPPEKVLCVKKLLHCVKDARTVESYVIERATNEREHIVLLSSVVAEKYKDIVYE
jgi:hypothetical protein